VEIRKNEVVQASNQVNVRIVAGGVVALAVAMGIGRFAFTPLLPLMLRDELISVEVGAEWAAANYLGYLIGAVTATRLPGDPKRSLNLSLLGVALTTLALALLDKELPVWLGAILRGAAGVFSAWALISTSIWGLTELARRRVPELGAWIYIGVGMGIMLSGTLSWLGGSQPVHWLWLEMGLFGAAGALFVRVSLGHIGGGSDLASPALTRPSLREHLPVVLCYGVFGFGYIIPATFLPVMARQQIDDPLVFGLTWPIFGLAAALSVVVVARYLSSRSRRYIWAVAHTVMALGTALPLVFSSIWSLALSSLLVGGTFMVATMAGLQLARERLPENPGPLLALMTIAFAAGQIFGPLFVRLLGLLSAGWNPLVAANAVASALLLTSAAWLWRGSDASTKERVRSHCGGK
jgi:MFS family permease